MVCRSESSTFGALGTIVVRQAAVKLVQRIDDAFTQRRACDVAGKSESPHALKVYHLPGQDVDNVAALGREGGMP